MQQIIHQQGKLNQQLSNKSGKRTWDASCFLKERTFNCSTLDVKNKATPTFVHIRSRFL